MIRIKLYTFNSDSEDVTLTDYYRCLMQSLFSFQNDPCNKLRLQQLVKNTHHLLQVFKSFPFQSLFSQKPDQKILPPDK